MSMGKCHDQCIDSYAFAIVQDTNCWCSNYVPANQVSTSECDTPCPGFPDDLCGNSSQGLYGYIKLVLAASGTAGGSSTAAPTSVSTIPYALLPQSQISELHHGHSVSYYSSSSYIILPLSHDINVRCVTCALYLSPSFSTTRRLSVYFLSCLFAVQSV
jgi:cell wall integrity and stress response component